MFPITAPLRNSKGLFALVLMMCQWFQSSEKGTKQALLRTTKTRSKLGMLSPPTLRFHDENRLRGVRASPDPNTSFTEEAKQHEACGDFGIISWVWQSHRNVSKAQRAKQYSKKKSTFRSWSLVSCMICSYWPALTALPNNAIIWHFERLACIFCTL